MHMDFQQIEWDEAIEADCRALVRAAREEDLRGEQDWTTASLVPAYAVGRAHVVARRAGVVAGLPGARLAAAEFDPALQFRQLVQDGTELAAGQAVAVVEGLARSMLTAERTLLNLLGRLSGIATLAREYVDAVAGTKARIYDTRKTTPGWRRLEKYAVRQGGAHNHRTGLFDAVLIKDNHLAFIASSTGSAKATPTEAVRRCREFLRQQFGDSPRRYVIVEVEVDSLEQLEAVLPEKPDIVLLDNMTPGVLRSGVALRDRLAPTVELEASGGVNLQTVRAIAESGVDRISVGALTHSAVVLDLGLDWG